MGDQHIITVTAENDEHVVTLPGGEQYRYASHKAAFGAAVGWRMVHGGKVVDLASGAAISDMLGLGKAVRP